MLVILCTGISAHDHDLHSCNYQQRVCECNSNESVCYFSLIVEDLLSVTSYPLVRSSSGKFTRELNGQYTQYRINGSNAGKLTPRNRQGDCVIEPVDGPIAEDDERFHANNCSIPMIIDAVGNSPFIAVNGLIPGPTLVVNDQQTVVVEVTNALINKEVSVHWHGQFQNNTPWMDGVDHITQCPIPTYASFRYIFKASPSGTMWYHSHVGTQRTEGLFGALIVRENETIISETEEELQRRIGEQFTIVDNPEHTLSFLDWQREDGVEIALRSIGRNESRRRGTDGASVSRVRFYAGLINGLGVQMDISFVDSRLSIFNVDYYDENSPKFYRFRLVGAIRQYMFNFSIADHKLIVIAMDGFLTEPREVDYIFIHAGERYDFLLKPKTREEANGRENYLISGYTLERDVNMDRALAFLHYGSREGNPDSSEYEDIINSTAPRSCSDSSVCEALNCPFPRFIPYNFIDCIPVTNMSLLFSSQDIPSNDRASIMSNERFFDFSFTGSGGSAAISGRNFAFPAGSLQTQTDNSSSVASSCESGYLDCSANRSQCICLRIVGINDPWGTIQFVLTNIGGGLDKAAHPIHIHGHSFQVVGIYYGEYDDSTGKLIGENGNVICRGPGGSGLDPLCTNPNWTAAPVDGTVTTKTIRKDTIVVPPGGYVALRFISDNWGFWYMHCHIEPHFLEGMAAVINEAWESQNEAPQQQADLQCGDFYWTVEDFDNTLNNPIPRRDANSPTDCPGISKAVLTIGYID